MSPSLEAFQHRSLGSLRASPSSRFAPLLIQGEAERPTQGRPWIPLQALPPSAAARHPLCSMMCGLAKESPRRALHREHRRPEGVSALLPLRRCHPPPLTLAHPHLD